MTSRLDELNAFIRVPSDMVVGGRDGAWARLLSWNSSSQAPDWKTFFPRLKEAVQEAMRLPVDRRVAQADEWKKWMGLWHECHELAPNAAKHDPALYERRLGEQQRVLNEWAALNRLIETAWHILDGNEWFTTVGAIHEKVFPERSMQADETAWHRICGRLLLTDRINSHTVRVAVVLVEMPEPGAAPRGRLGLLECTAIKDGTGTAYRHPIDELVVPPEVVTFRPAQDFSSSIQRALDAARVEAPEGQPCDGVWSLSNLAPVRVPPARDGLEAGELVASPIGASAGGAAFRAFWHAIQWKIPDDEVVVIAELNGDTDHGFTVIGVDPGPKPDHSWIRAKVKSVIDDGGGRFDTLVVVDDNRHNRRVAEEVLKAEKSEIVLVALSADGSPSGADRAE